jgi:hypothetical protein
MGKAWVMRPLKPAVVYHETAPGFSPDALFSDYLGVVWRSFTGGELLLDFGADVAAVDAIALFGCSGAEAGWEWKVLGTLTGNYSQILVESAWMPFLAGAEMPSHGRGVALWENGAPVSARYWRIQFRNLGGAPLTIGRLAIGRKLTLERNFAFGGGFGLRDLGQADFSSAGALLRRRAAKLRTLGLTFPAVKKDEVEAKIQPLIELSAGQEPIVLVTDPDAHPQRQKRCWFGLMFGDHGTIWARPGGWEWRANLVDLVAIPSADAAKPRKYRYWRVRTSSTATGGYFGLAELQMRTVAGSLDRTAGKTAFASADFGGPYVPSAAIDDNAATFWTVGTNAPPAGGHWLAVDFGVPVEIGEVVLTVRPDAFREDPLNLFIDFSSDGGDWFNAAQHASIPAWSAGETRAFAV